MKVVVYDDSLDFGGHQIMACRGIESLTADPALEVIALSRSANHRFNERLAGIPRLQVIALPGTPGRLQGLCDRLTRLGTRELEQQIRTLDPDLVLCIQGDIEQSSRAIQAARRAGVECVSYIAITHRLTDMNAKMGTLRDLSNQYLLNLPDRYITISNGMQQMLVDRGVKKQITVVPNGVDKPQTANRIPQTSNPVLGLIGRVEFKQKRQDFMVETFCNHADAFKNCRLLIAGSGPDDRRLQKLVEECPRRGEITLQSWQDDIEPLLNQIDFLMLPSRYEGMPLIMLEALTRGIPVIGSARDGMADLLPPAWLFEPGNAAELATTFAGVRHIWPNDIGRLQDMVRTEMTIEAFQAAFHQAVVCVRA